MTPPGLPILGRPHLRIVQGTSTPGSVDVPNRDEWLTLLVTCPECKEETGLRIPIAGAVAWENGELIQNAFPDLNDTDRERLLTGYCQKCWDEMFAYLDDEEEGL